MHWLLSKLIPTLLTLLCVALIINNMGTPSILHLNEGSQVSLSQGVLLAVFFLTGILAASSAYMGLKLRLLTRVKQQELRREQAQVSHETAHDHIQALEAKVMTLETALDTALSRTV